MHPSALCALFAHAGLAAAGWPPSVIYNGVGTFYVVATVFGSYLNDTDESPCYGIPSCALILDGSNQPGLAITVSPLATPIPPAPPLFATALGGLGFAAWRRRARSIAS